MTELKQFFASLMKDEDGATMVEYGLMIALVAIVVAAGAYAVGTSTNNLFLTVSGVLDNANTNASANDPFGGGTTP